MDPYRLPRTVVPSRYELHLEPDLATATFTGRVRITLQVNEPTPDIVLNSAELVLAQAIIDNTAGPPRAATIALDEAAERARLSFSEPLEVGAWQLDIAFSGALNDKLRGFYRSRYKDDAGTWHTLAATQFEATDARRAFPCWDEPAFKAVFSTTLVIDPALQAVSNTRILDERNDGNKRIIRFADTIPMSTYLVAFIVGNLEATEPVLVGRTPLRVWCVPGKKHLAALGQEVGAFSLRWYEQYYGGPYPGDKLDLVAIPDFAAGAMENLGAITFRETALLVDVARATHAERERVADVVSHENAHMWFGDLVTMEWWNGLWLNEAFATFLEMLAVDAWKPQWQRWTTFGVSRAAALNVDALWSTRPIEFPVAAPRDADAMFDVLTYEKGASVLRMLEQYMGSESFRAGVRIYLDRHAFGNTQTVDLWRALSEPASLPIPQIMDGWVFQPGYPVVSVQLGTGGQLVLRQQRFTYLPAEQEAASAPIWQIPMQVRVITSAAAQELRILLREAQTSLPLPQDMRAVVVNQGGHGFYRVRYSADLLQRVLNSLSDLAPIERFNLVSDAWAAVLAGLSPLPEYLDLTARFRNEVDRNVWSALLASFQSLARIVQASDRAGLEAMLRDRLGPAAARLGWEPTANENELTQQLRGDILRTLGTLGNNATVQQRAEEIFDAASAGRVIDGSIMAAVIAVLAHTGTDERYEEFLKRFRAAHSPQEEQRYLLALAGFREPALIEQTLQRTLNGDIRTQDAPFVLRTMLLGVDSRRRAWDFLRENWERIQAQLPAVGVRRLCEGVIGLCTPAWEREVRDFFTQRHVQLGGKALEQYLEQLHVAVRLVHREGEALSAYLRTYIA